MQIRAYDLPVSAQRAVTSSVIEHNRRSPQSGATADSRMNLITGYGYATDLQCTADIAQLLFRVQHRIEVEPTETSSVASGAFQPQWIAQTASEHLKAATKDRKSTRLNSSHLGI